jgi:general L-amino acid transport system permease protein
VAFVVGIVASVLLVRYSNRRRDLTGQIIPVFWPSLGLIFGLPVLVWLLAGAPIEWNVPELKGFNFRGGAKSTPEFAALLAGLVAYTAAFIAEIVRSGIQSVGIGQIEAARSVGLRPGQIMRLITIPQALRVIVPPVTSMYLSLTKNSSLAVAIGYPELVNVGNTTVNQTGQAVEAIALMMLVYLIISLTISTCMNYYNRYVAIVER